MAIEAKLNTAVLPDDAVAQKFSDTVEIDQTTHTLYLGDNWSGGVDVFDIAGGGARYLQTIGVRRFIYGLAVASDIGKLFVAALPSAVAVIDIRPDSPSRHEVVERIDTFGPGHSDLIDYDPVHQKIYVANRNDHFLIAIDAVANKVVAKVDGLGGGLEQPRFNAGDGMVYLTSHDENALHQIDPESDRLVRTLPIEVPCSPNGLAVNPTANQAILAGSDRKAPNTVVWDFGTQTVAEVIEGCGCGDGATYLPTLDRYLFAASNYPPEPVVGVFRGAPVELLAAVHTSRRASWVACDETTHVAYVPGVEQGKPALQSFSLDEVDGALD